MKLISALLAALAVGDTFAAVATTLATQTASPVTSVPGTTSPVSSPVSTPGTQVSETIVPPSEPSYPPATGTPGPVDQQIDSVVSELRSNVVNINARYNATCANSCNAGHIQAWGDEHAKVADVALTKLRAIPVGYVYWWYPRLVWNLGWIWIEIYYTLYFIWFRAGLVWELIYFNRYLWNFYVSWRALFWYFGRFAASGHTGTDGFTATTGDGDGFGGVGGEFSGGGRCSTSCLGPGYKELRTKQP
ncbi:hypothetical protein EYR41_002615 [Orbilia oligospora]|uniref:Uncharacterized protein n=1 Tax=Orbilia oligospora TaxID=2813651 RepID=A0A7C8PUI0_ORBOL|nr:hypothetical protein TWF751_011674 [Orbilia oligospora]TGJ70580.1 hypothetical protein EYR41_002615 [Orbilia oligospora]